MPLASRSDTSFDRRPKEDEEWVAAEEKRAEEEAARKAEEAQGVQREAGAARLA